MATRTLHLVLSFLLLSATLSSATNTNAPSPKHVAVSPVNDDEDLSFLEEPVDDTPKPPSYVYDEEEIEAGEYGSYEDFKEWNSANPQRSPPASPAIDERDVVVLNGTNFADFITKNKYVMVEFYAPWCSYCMALAPEYAAAATELKDDEVKLAKVDGMEDGELATKYQVDGFPAIFFFADGEFKQYNGERSREGIVGWTRKKIGPGVQNVTTTEEAENILSSESKAVVAYLDNLTGDESAVLASAARQEDDDHINYYQTTSPDVAKLFLIDPKAKRPALVLLKKQPEKLTNFDGEFSKSAITKFVSANKLPLVVNFTRETSAVVFESPIKKQVLLFAPANESEKLIPTFEAAAKAFKGKLIFVYVEMDNKDFGKPVSEYFGINGVSTKVLAYTGNEDARKFLFHGDLTLDQIKTFAEEFLADKLKPFYKSEPIPEKNNDDVKVVVGENFEDFVLDESKDVLLEIYAPWCPHCDALEPVYNKLAHYLNGVDSMAIAKMDGTANEHPRAKSDGFPTILFFPAGKKSLDPITYEGDRTVVEMYKFLKKNASIPFKIKKPTPPKSDDGVDVTISNIETVSSKYSEDVRDEL